MSSDADRFWEDLAGKLRKKKGLCPLTPEEAEQAYAEAPEVPLSPDLIESMVESIVAGEDPPPWEPVSDEDWDADPAFDEIEEEALALFRNQGEVDPDAEKAEKSLEEKLLNDDATEDDQA
jgi:hypothetical protein